MNKNALLIIVSLVVLIPIFSLVFSAIKHTKEEKMSLIRQKFERISLIFSLTIYFAQFLLGILIIGISSMTVFKPIFIWLGIIFSLFGGLLILGSIIFFRHVIFELSRNIYFDRLNQKILVKKGSIEKLIDLGSSNIDVIVFESKMGPKIFPYLGKIIIKENGEEFIISDILDFTPELIAHILKTKNIKITKKLINWI